MLPNRVNESAPALVQRIHIDTDPGLDDLLALALALASPEVKLEAVTTVAGNARLEAVTANACGFLALVGVEIPVGRGARGPLSLTPTHAEQVHGPDGRRGIPLPTHNTVRPSPALSVFQYSLRERRVEQIIALGPLTNLAKLVSEQRSLLENVEIVWMGGTLSEGNVTPVAEFNAYADPEATASVLRSGLRIRVIGLDVTTQLRLRGRDLRDSPFGTTPTGRVLDQALRALMETERPLHGEPCALLHDPAAVAAAIFPSWFRFERKVLEVRVEEGRDRGRMVEHDRGDGPSVEYAVEVRGPEVLQLCLTRLAAWSGKVDSD